MLRFKTEDREELYRGDSYYNAKIVDQLDITGDHIAVTFSRTAKAHPEEYVFSEKSPVRFQFYRAACFYLAVKGNLPEVESLSLDTADVSLPMDRETLLHGWTGCSLRVTLPKETAGRCFVKDGNWIYTVMTYFLKAQLDNFSNDAFRAAWSGLNGVSNRLSDSRHENEKLSALREWIRKNGSREAENYAKKLDEDFWKHVDWYNYVQGTGIQKVEIVIRCNQYRDRIIYQKLSGYVLGVMKKERPDQAEEFSNFIEKRKKKKVVDANERVRFLVTEYCYMLRNRSFHAGKAYPIFRMVLHDVEDMDTKLTTLLLLTIRDFLVEETV